VWEKFMEFYTDNNVKELWSNTYGKITTLTFMIYGYLGKKDNIIINYAIRDAMGIDKFAQTIEEIDWEMANLFGIYQGTCIQWVFPSDLKEIDLVTELISEGLEYHRIKHECIGATVDVYERTT
tara:strand:- start:166 stop:537 length:372 start_codon:yes stop_codon:yes gene_type:complete